MSNPFAPRSDADIVRLVAENPLAWIVASADPGRATPMPMLLDLDSDGNPISVTGHLPRAHPLFETLGSDPRVLLLFQGPHAYISPACLTDKNWAPTWNFAVAKIAGRIRFDADLTDEALTRLVGHMEGARAAPWDIAALGQRYETLRARVIGFRIAIDSIEGRFKLGQDERPEVFERIVESLGDDPLADWMRRYSA